LIRISGAVMKIYLLRHGPAMEAAEAGGDDRARRLSHDGRRRTIQAARAMARLDVRPGLILSSPLARALETAELTAKELGMDGATRKEPRLEPGATPKALAQALAQVLRRAGKDVDSVMLVGHNPDLELFLAWLTAPDAQAALTLAKGALAVIELDDARAALKAPGCGRLVALWPGKALARLARR
jgi:phosphohistidine phosphatase